jgi:hypothetical protein
MKSRSHEINMPIVDQEGASDEFSVVRSRFNLELNVDHRSGMEMLNRQIVLKEIRWSTLTLTTPVIRSSKKPRIPEGQSPEVPK